MPNYDSEKLMNHLKSKLPSLKCPLCGNGAWGVSDNIFELRQFNQGNIIVGGVPIIPVIPIVCNNCGNTILINALVSAVLEQQRPNSTSTKESVEQPKPDSTPKKEGGNG